MSKTICAHVNEELEAHIESLAEYHDISKSNAIKLLLLEGIRAREMRLRFEQLDAKLDVLIENLGGEQVAEKKIEDRLDRVLDRGLPGDLYGLKSKPHPFYQPASDTPDRSSEEEAVKQQLLDERDQIETPPKS